MALVRSPRWGRFFVIESRFFVIEKRDCQLRPPGALLHFPWRRGDGLVVVGHTGNT